MKICQNCGHENRDNGRFCSKCGMMLDETPNFCPECGTELEEGSLFCSECGYNLSTESVVENDKYEKEVYNCDNSNDYEEYVNEDEYVDDEPLRDKIRKIVDKYISIINKGYTWYKASSIPNYPQIFQNVRSHIAKDIRQSDILGFIDTSVLGKGKAGLVFTTEALYEESPGALWKVPYKRMQYMNCNGKKIKFGSTSDCGIGWMVKGMDISIDNTYYNIPALKDCLDEICAII